MFDSKYYRRYTELSSMRNHIGWDSVGVGGYQYDITSPLILLGLAVTVGIVKNVADKIAKGR
jgi:hypothetical protein